MFGLGFSEIILLGVLALIIIGPKQLPDVARTLGRFLNELKRATDDFKDDFKRQAKADLDFNSISIQNPMAEIKNQIHQQSDLPQSESEIPDYVHGHDEYLNHIGGDHHSEEEKQLSLNLDSENPNESKKTEGT